MEKGQSGISMRRIAIIVLMGGVLCVAVYFAAAYWNRETKPTAKGHLKAGGTSTVALILDKSWRSAYRMHKDVEVDYETTGSAKGVDGMIDGKFPLAFTQAPLTDEQKKKAKDKGGELVQVPVVIYSVVPLYNLPKLKTKQPLQFSGEVLAEIFLGKIKKWNDPALKELNKEVDLPDAEIIVVHREGPAGTTFLFTDYLAGVSSAWKDKVGKASSEVKWPVGVGKTTSSDLVGYVKETAGAIGYVELDYAYPSGAPLRRRAEQGQDGLHQGRGRQDDGCRRKGTQDPR